MLVNTTIISDSTNGSWYERNGFNLGIMAIIWVFLALIAFNIVGGLVGVIAAVFLVDDPTNIEALMQCLVNKQRSFFGLIPLGK